jgi:hypothetical protein
MHVVTPIFCGLFRKLKISYTREFLLSFCGLDVCKEFPSGFDRSLLRYSIYILFRFYPKNECRGAALFLFIILRARAGVCIVNLCSFTYVLCLAFSVWKSVNLKMLLWIDREVLVLYQHTVSDALNTVHLLQPGGI